MSNDKELQEQLRTLMKWKTNEMIRIMKSRKDCQDMSYKKEWEESNEVFNPLINKLLIELGWTDKDFFR